MSKLNASDVVEDLRSHIDAAGLFHEEWSTDGPDAYGTFYPDMAEKSGFLARSGSGDEFIITVQKRG